MALQSAPDTSAPTILDHCYDETGAATFTEKSPRTLQRWRALRSGPPFIKLGNRILYPKGDLLRWVLSQGAS
jgi:hypothetical protein